MKTPRQILLERHRAAESKLDRLRQTALADLTPARREPSPATASLSFRELFLSLRGHVAGMSAVWLVALLLQMDAPGDPPLVSAKNSSLSPQQLLAALRENRRQLSEWIEPIAAPKPMSAPTTLIPRRRSELPASNAMA